MNPSPRDNFYRCMTLIVDNGNEAAWELLDFYLSNQGTTLKSFIENNQHEIYHLCYNYSRCCRCQFATVNKPKSRILYPSQLDILLDTKGSNIPCYIHVHAKPTCSHTINDHYANPNIATNQLDLTLLGCLLINFTNILPQGSVERNAFEHLIKMRNKYCHAAKGEISSKDYQADKAQIEKCLMALAQVYGKTYDMQLKIKDAEKRPFDESICKQLQQTILQVEVLQKIERIAKRALQVVKAIKKSPEHTTTKVQKLDENTERTLKAVDASQKSVEITSAKLEKKQDENTERALQGVEYNAANIEKKLEENSERTLQAVESNQELVEHTAAKIQKLENNTEKTMHAIDSSREAEERTANKIQKLEELLSKCEPSKRSGLIEPSKRSGLIGLTQTEIDGHLTTGTFVETPAVQACIKLLETNSLLILTGAAGTGKSRNSLEILHQFRVKHPEYKLVKLTDLHDFTDVVLVEEKLVILFEDIFGRTNTRFAENTDVQIMDRLHACIIKGNIKVILTVRDTIRMSCESILNAHTIFHGKCEVDLSSEKFKMTKIEKESLLLKYFVANNFRLLDSNEPENYNEEIILDPQITATVNRVTLHNIVESEPLLGFPEACSLFTGNRKLTRLGLSFFKHPSKYLYEEIEKLRKNGKDNEQDRMSYVTLIYILLNEDVLDPDDIQLKICFEILESCYGISNKKLPVSHITDAANEMKGRYLIFHCDDGTYHFQHQTIFESILISYSKIDPGLILSRLRFDFIREMVRLQNYTVRQGEIVMKISTKYYSMLSNRIIEIILSEYFNKSLSLNFQLLCESEIIRQNDESFMKSLIDKAHDAYFQPDYDLQTFVTYRGVCKLCKLYLPAFLLERITQQNRMNDSITLLVDHITLMLNSKRKEEIEFVCKSSLLDAFLNVCDLENNERILDNIWVSVRSLDMSEITEYIKSSINRVCSRCPMTTMKWMLNNIDRRIFDMNQLLKRACEFKRLDIVEFLCETINHSQLDFTAAFVAAINNVWNDTDESVSKWLINNIDLQLFDMKQITSEVLEVGCKEDLKFLLKNVDNCMLDIELVFDKLYKEERRSLESLLKWMGTNVEKKKLNTHEMSKQACMVEDFEVVKYLFNNIDLGPLDVMSVLMSSMNSTWRGDNKHLIQWICLNVDLTQINIMNIIYKAFEEERYDELKILLKNIKENHNTVLRDACKNKQLELINILLSVADHDKLNMREAVRSVCDVEKIELLEFFLYNVNHSLYDVHHVLKESCRYGWTHIIQWLLENIEHSSLDINTAMHTVLHREFVGPDNTLVSLLLQYPIHDKVDVTEIIKECCWWGLLDLVQLICEKNDPKQLDMKEAMNTACSRSHFELVEWLLSNVSNNLLDLPSAFNNAIHANRSDLNISLVKLLIGNIDHKLIDMTRLLKIGCEQFWYDIVEWVLENADHTLLDVKEEMNIFYDNWKYDFTICCDEEISNRREKYERLMILILEKVNHNSLDLQKVFYTACHYGALEVVTLVLENSSHEMLDMNKAMNIVYENWKIEFSFCCGGDINDISKKYVPLVKLILEKVHHDFFDLNMVLNHACRYGCIDVVTFVLETVDHEKVDVIEAINRVYISLGDNGDNDSIRKIYETLIILIIKKTNHDSLDFKKVLNQACWFGCLEIVKFLIENIDHEKLDVTEAVNRLCRDYDDDNTVQIEKCEPLIKLILEKMNHKSLDLKKVLNQACRYGYLDVVKFVLDNIDHEKLDLNEAMNMAYDQRGNNILGWRKEKYEPLIKLILEQVNHTSFDLKKVFNQACVYGCSDVFMFLLENIDHKKLDIMKAVNNAFSILWDDDNCEQREKKEPLIKLILEEVDHDLLDLKEIIDEACFFGFQDVVTFLLDNADHEKLDIMKAVNSAYNSFQYEDDIYEQREKNEHLIKFILEKVDHDLLDLKEIMNMACSCVYQDVVSFLLEKTDHEKLDIMEAVYIAYSPISDEDDEMDEIYEKREKKEPLIKLILEKVDHDLLDLKEIMNEACFYGFQDVVTFLLDNFVHEKLDIMKAVKSAYSPNKGGDYDENDINDQREKKEPLIKLILEKVNNDLLDLKEIIDDAFCYGYLDVVTFLLENTDHEKLHIMEAVNKSCNQSIDEETDDNSSNEELINILLQKVRTDLLDMEILMNVACRNGWLDIVRWLIENIDHSMFDVDTAITVFILHDSDDTLDIFVLILQNISPNLFNIGTVIEQASRLNHTDKVLWLLQNKDSSLFEMKYVMNEACRNSNLQIIKYVMENMDKDCFDVRTAMNKACRSSKPNSLVAVKWLLENIPHDMLDLESAMNNACRYDIVAVVEWFWTTLDRKLFNVKTAWNNACYNCNEALLSYLINNMDENMLDKSKAMSQACRNYEGGYEVIALLFKQPNMNTAENCKNVLKEACVHSNRPIVEWLFENTDIQPSELKETLIYAIKATTNKSNDEDKSDHESLVWLMIKHQKIKKLDRNDLSDVMEAVSSIGQLDMVQWLLHNTEQSIFNMSVIINTACELEKFEIVDWFLQNIDLTSTDVQTVMVESCGYGWLTIVKLLWSKFHKEHFDMRTSMDEACSYGRYEIVKFLLENVDSKFLDTNLVLEKACGYGWKDIILWLFANVSNISIDLKACMFEACAQGRLEIVELLISKYGINNFDVDILIGISCKNSGNRGVMKFLIENFDLTQSHIYIIVRTACKYGWTEILTLILDSCKHNKNLMEEAMKNACYSGETEIVKILLDKVDVSFIEIKNAMSISCQKGWDEIVSMLIERVDHSLFDLTGAMNEACRCGEADIVELLIQQVNHKFFNFENAIMEACQSHLNENLVLILLKYIDNSTRDIEEMSEKAREYGWRKVSSRLKRMSYNENKIFL